jgi:hypothetical protein
MGCYLKVKDFRKKGRHGRNEKHIGFHGEMFFFLNEILRVLGSSMPARLKSFRRGCLSSSAIRSEIITLNTFRSENLEFF